MIKERANELNRLHTIINKPGFSSCLIYGKPNSGKSSLVHTVIKDNPATKIFLHVDGESKEIVLSSIRRKCAEAFPNILLPKSNEITQLVKFIFENSVNEKIILVIDDFNKFIKLSMEMVTFLKSFQSRFKSYGNIKFICISDSEGLYKEAIESSKGTNPHFNEIIEMNQFDYFTSSTFYSRAFTEERLYYYSVFGGSPFYNSLINPTKNFIQNLKDLLLYNDSPLRSAIKNQLNESFAKKHEADELLCILAEKKFARYGELKSEFKSRSLQGDFDYTLNKLIELGVVEKKAPLHYENDKKKFYYEFSDSVYEFFYTLVFKQTEDDVLPEEIDKTFETSIKKAFEEEFFPHRLRFIAMEFIIREGKKGKFKEDIIQVAPYFPNPRSLDWDGTIVAETLSGNYYAILNASRGQLEKKRVESLAYSLYEKQRPFKNLILISRGIFAANINRLQYITYRLPAMYSKI